MLVAGVEEELGGYDGDQLAALVLAIATINAFNRVNAMTRQITGDWVGQVVQKEALHR